jgi:hypothetical protein
MSQDNRPGDAPLHQGSNLDALHAPIGALGDMSDGRSDFNCPDGCTATMFPDPSGSGELRHISGPLTAELNRIASRLRARGGVG